jgi:hypothetical protein
LLPQPPADSPEQWLTREIGDLLEAGTVGLYELIWLLNGSEFDLADSAKKSIAYAVTNDIVNSGRAKLYELRWPANEVLDGPVDLATMITGSDAWPSVASERFLALVPQEPKADKTVKQTRVRPGGG